MRGIDWDALPNGGDLYGEMHLAEASAPKQSMVPGLLACATAAGTAAWLSDHYGFPIVLLGLLIGLALNFIARDPVTHPGLDFASRTCLRLGIVALGLQVTFSEIGRLGLAAFGALLAIMVLTAAAGIVAARLCGQGRHAGVLAGGATAICGASAALALYGVIGRSRLSQAQFALTLVGVSLASALAMSTYPMIAGELGLTDRQAGFLIGASIHDVAQAIGGGYAFSDQAGAYATIVKLSRVALLAPLVALAGLWLGAEPNGNGGNNGQEPAPVWKRLALPWFIVAFLAVLAINSMVGVPAELRGAALTGSKGLLLLAVTATAMRSRMDLLMELGWRALVPVIAATATSLVASLVLAVTVVG